MSTISSSPSPATHRAAIDALDAQRAAYRRLAREAESQQGALSAGDADQAATFTEAVAGQVDALQEGARAVRALVDQASHGGSELQLRDIEHRMNEMMREAHTAETAIRNLSSQLEAWRDAFGRQLTELGITPGSGTPGAGSTGGDGADPAAPRRSGYGHTSSTDAVPRLFDRKG